jgi:hypothetical protein
VPEIVEAGQARVSRQGREFAHLAPRLAHVLIGPLLAKRVAEVGSLGAERGQAPQDLCRLRVKVDDMELALVGFLPTLGRAVAPVLAQ